jgi:hypothetical protein
VTDVFQPMIPSDRALYERRYVARLVVTLAGGMPHVISDVVALAAELSGVAAFRLLLESGRELFADEPDVVAQIEDLFGQILVDEVGHVRFLRSRLGPVRLRIAAALLPLVTRGMIDDMPELVALLGRTVHRRGDAL